MSTLFIYLPRWKNQGIHGSGEHLESRGRCAYLLLPTRSEERQEERQEESTDFTAVPVRAKRTCGLDFA